MRKAISAVVASAAFFSVGCVVYRDRPVERRVEVVREVDEPVGEGPGVTIVEVEPPPVERVYVYEVGYPPGCYYWNGYYWYGGYRYEREVFVTRVVQVNIRERRYVNVTENRRMGEFHEHRDRTEFARTAGRRAQVSRPPAARRRTPQ